MTREEIMKKYRQMMTTADYSDDYGVWRREREAAQRWRDEQLAKLEAQENNQQPVD